jgi:GT2 family glycosyltransferase
MKISFVIVNYKTKSYLTNCIQSILKTTTGEYEIIIVDNHSGDNLDDIQDLSPEHIQIIYAQTNNGFGSGVNIGANIATGDWLCILNPDTKIQGDIHTLSTIEQNTGIIGIALVNHQNIVQPYQYGSFPTPISILLNTAKKQWKSPPEQTIATDWVSGGSLCIRRALFQQLQGFDERFFMYYEDIDICRRAQQAGYGIQWTQNITIWHQEGGAETNRVATKARYYTAQRQYIAKWYGKVWNILLYPLHQALLLILNVL